MYGVGVGSSAFVAWTAYAYAANLTLDPMAREAGALPGWAALVDGWSETGRLDEIPAAARAWACKFMLRDLAGRYPPAELAHVRRTLEQLA